MIYRELAERYGWPPQVVAEMTPEQQLMYLQSEVSPKTGRPVVRFKSEKQYHEWLAGRSK